MRHLSQRACCLQRGAPLLTTHPLHPSIPSIPYSTHLALWSISATCSGAESKANSTATMVFCHFSKCPAHQKSPKSQGDRRTRGSRGRASRTAPLNSRKLFDQLQLSCETSPLINMSTLSEVFSSKISHNSTLVMM